MADAASSRTKRVGRAALLLGGAILLVFFLVILTRVGPGPAVREQAGDLSRTPFLALALLSFVAGMLGFFSPCTLPLLPAYFAVTFRSEQKRVLVMTVAFLAGLALTFALFGALAGILGQVLGRVGLSRLDLARLGGVIITAFGVMALLGKGFGGNQSGVRRSASLWGSFAFGATFALGWTTCTGPVLGAVTTLAVNANYGVLEGDVGQSAAVLGSALLLVVFAAGLGVPLVLVSTFFGRADRESLFWRILRGKGWSVTVLGKPLYLHSNSVLSGALFIALGVLMMAGRLTLLNNLVPDELALRAANAFEAIEDWLASRVGG